MSDLVGLFARKASAELAELNREISSCSRATGIPVVGSGNPFADIVLVKLAPDSDEESAGLAFDGRSGDVVVKSADKLDLPCEVLYGTNLVKCRSDDPACGEKCRARLAEELAIIEPCLVFAMGEPVFVAACRVLGHECEFEPGALVRRTGRATLVGTVDFENAMADEGAKKQLWHDLKLLAAEYLKG